MSITQKKIIRAVAEFLLLALMMAAVPWVVEIDSAGTGHGPAEWSLTELLQEGLLLASAAMFWYVAWRRPDSRGFLVLVAGFFTTMLIREMDAWLDAIAKGFWVYPAAAVVFGTIVYALKNRPTLFKPMARHLDTKPFILITIGLVIVIVFSRMFGSGSLWLVVMGEAFNPVYKTVIQEGCELMGYAIITYGTVLNTFGKESIAT